MPKISVIVPVYKAEKFLATCIESILNQTYGNLEIILVDDGSPDSCGKICEKYASWRGWHGPSVAGGCERRRGHAADTGAFGYFVAAGHSAGDHRAY